MLGRKSNPRRGATLVEFAIAASVFFLLVFIGIEFSRAIWQYNIVANAAKSAVRWASVRGASSGNTPTDSAGVYDYIGTQMYGYPYVDTVTWSPSKEAGSTITVVVRSSYTVRVPRFMTRSLTLRSRAQMIVAR